MSFKREGDDHSWLNVLNKRRVSELLAENIPEDEAYLMKNGRLACLVCANRPVFDTISMLSMHRGGKKHLYYAGQFKSNKDELEVLHLKRQHENYVASGKLPVTTANSTTSKSESRLLGACVYDPRSKRRKTLPTQRRLTLNMELTSKLASNTTSTTSLPPLYPGTSDSPGDNIDLKPPQTIAEMRKLRAALSSTEQHIVKPYTSMRTTFRDQTHFTGGSSSCKHSTPVASSFADTRTSNLHPFGHTSVASTEVLAGSSSFAACISAPDASIRSTFTPAELQRLLQPPESTVAREAKNDIKDDSLKREQIATYLKAVGSGWKRSRDGVWVKDEDAEFDSDDEPPPCVA